MWYESTDARDILLPPAFQWFKNGYLRGGQTRLFRYPSPASEDPASEERGYDNYRTPYQYSQHNVRVHTFLNPGADNHVHLYIEPKDSAPIEVK